MIFVPLAFLSGVTGAFFKALSITMAVALALSFLVAWWLVPMLVEQLAHRADGRGRGARRAPAVSCRATAACSKPVCARPLADVSARSWRWRRSGSLAS